MQKYYCVFYEFIITTLYLLFVLLLMIYNNVTSIHRLCAFNVNILCNIQDKSNIYKIKNISLLKLNRQNKKSYYSYLFICNQFLQYMEKQNHYLLHQYINNLQLSGFINSFNHTKIILNTRNYLAFTINYNPVIRSIKITNYNKLTIPSSRLSKILHPQLGLPRNYQLVHDAIKQIILWYRCQGFEWVRVKLDNHYQVNQINIVIYEGVILSNKIICDNYNQISNYKHIDTIIKSELNLMPGNTLNKKQLDNSIKHLKHIYCIKDLQYDVTSYKSGLHITITYNIEVNNHLNINYCYSQATSFMRQILLNIYHTNLISFTKFNFLYFVKFYIRVKDLYNIQLNLYSQQVNLHKYIKSIYIQSLSSINSHQKDFTYYIKLYWIKLKKIHLKQTFYMSYLINFLCKSIYDINEQICLVNQYYITRFKYINLYLHLTCLQNLNLLSQVQYKYYIFSDIFHYKTTSSGVFYLSLAKIINTIAIKMSYHLINQITNYKYNLYNQEYNVNQFMIFCINQVLDLGSIHKYYKNLYLNINYNMLNTFIARQTFYDALFIGIKRFNLYPSTILQTKYGIYTNNSIYLYVFNNYVSYTKMLMYENFNYHFINNYNYYIGFGTQIKIPLKQMPYIRVEYIINYKKKIYIFIDKFAI